ncbi:MAG TPA: nitrate reductase [Candidatus Synoicihabitans sp.]|nr:nitrate reductase [Candidatus Synoicihabitans sp.]
MTTTLEALLRAREGPLTSELVLHPGDFGLGRVPARLAPTGTTRSTCGFCSTGCGLKVHLGPDGTALNLTPDTDYPVNLGMACPKGWEALTPLAAADRATTPLRRHAPGGEWQPIDWPTALDTFVTRMKETQARHGPHSIAFLSTGQVPTEELALLGALFKFGMGGLHCDSNTRQCMATSHVAYKQSFGFDAPPYTYQDFERSDVLVFVGANPAIAHPIMWQRVMRNPHRPEIVVIDPRRTETAMLATRHLAIDPKGDLWLLYAIAHELVARGWVHREFIDANTNGFSAFETFLQAYSPEVCAPHCGIAADEIRTVARLIGQGRAVSFWWTMGVNQGHESTRVAQAIINLALITGNIGRPGTGANSITGQCNAMGSRLYANVTSLFGGRQFDHPEHRAEVAQILQIPDSMIPTQPSWAYDQIIDGIERGEIRALWVIATNPAHSWINHDRVRRLREKLDFLVVQDMYTTTETAQMADLILPAAGWGEKEGTFINSERRFGVVRKVARAPGQALTDFAIFQLIAEAWGCGDLLRPWSSPEAAFRLLRELSRGRPCDITGIDGYGMLDAHGGIQWPYTEEDARAAAATQSRPLKLRSPRLGGTGPAETGPDVWRERRLFADGKFFTPDGRAKLHFDPPRPPQEIPDQAYPFWLNTGRGSSAQWHTGSRTNKSAVLRKLAPTELYVEVNPADAARLELVTGVPVIVRSRRGDVRAAVAVTATVRPGHVFLPMHFATVNRLTLSAFDPHSRQPSFKACAVTLLRPSAGRSKR